MRKIACLLIVACAAFVAAACACAEKESSERKEPAREVANPPADYGPRLLEIAAEYATYTRRGDYPYWAPVMCAAPIKPKPEAPMLSASKDDATHGRKLYFLYAHDNPAYEKGGAQPVGQAFVKESFAPEEVPERDAMAAHTTEHDGKFYKPGEKRALFIMFKLGAATADTHDGWVYGTVSADGKTVTSKGLVESCMSCHKDAPDDHLFGPKGAAPKAK